MHPTVSILIPTLGRPEGLRRLLVSIARLNYDPALIQTLVLHDEPRLGVPKRLKQGVERSSGQYIVFAANDMEFTSPSLMLAIRKALEGFDLVAFNTGEISFDEGNICEHFLIRRDFIASLHPDDSSKASEIFDTDLAHVGVDNLLWAQARKYGQAISCREAVVIHRHFSKSETEKSPWDDVYAMGWSQAAADRALLAMKLEALV